MPGASVLCFKERQSGQSSCVRKVFSKPGSSTTPVVKGPFKLLPHPGASTTDSLEAWVGPSRGKSDQPRTRDWLHQTIPPVPLRRAHSMWSAKGNDVPFPLSATSSFWDWPPKAGGERSERTDLEKQALEKPRAEGGTHVRVSSARRDTKRKRAGLVVA